MEGVRLHVRNGELADAGAWVYAWVAAGDDPCVVYVGATGLHPATRTWLHLHDPDPDISRIAARVSTTATEPFEVLAEPVPDGVVRSEERDAVIARLSELGLLTDRYVGFPPVVVERFGEAAERLVARIVELLEG